MAIPWVYGKLQEISNSTAPVHRGVFRGRLVLEGDMFVTLWNRFTLRIHFNLMSCGIWGHQAHPNLSFLSYKSRTYHYPHRKGGWGLGLQ